MLPHFYIIFLLRSPWVVHFLRRSASLAIKANDCTLFLDFSLFARALCCRFFLRISLECMRPNSNRRQSSVRLVRTIDFKFSLQAIFLLVSALHGKWNKVDSSVVRRTWKLRRKKQKEKWISRKYSMNQRPCHTRVGSSEIEILTEWIYLCIQRAHISNQWSLYRNNASDPFREITWTAFVDNAQFQIHTHTAASTNSFLVACYLQ